MNRDKKSEIQNSPSIVYKNPFKNESYKNKFTKIKNDLKFYIRNPFEI